MILTFQNTVMAKSITAENDPTLLNHMKLQISNILESDELCYREDVDGGQTYHRQLGKIQNEAYDPILKYLSDQYGINLTVFTGMGQS